MVILILLLWVTNAYSADAQNISNLVKDAKQKTFHTTRPSSIDPYVQKQIENLAKTDPDKYNKLVAYDQQQNQKNNSSTQKKKK